MNKAQLEKALQHRHDSEAPTDLAAHEATVADGNGVMRQGYLNRSG